MTRRKPCFEITAAAGRLSPRMLTRAHSGDGANELFVKSFACPLSHLDLTRTTTPDSGHWLQHNAAVARHLPFSLATPVA
jgi:hypothetical protein